MRLLCLILLLLSAKCFAQYPFEKLPVRKFDSVTFKVHYTKDSTQIAVARYGDYKFEIFERRLNGGSNIILYSKGRVIKRIKGIFSMANCVLQTMAPLYTYTENGKTNFIISYGNEVGTGLAGSRVAKVYLIEKENKSFVATSFGDFWERPFNQYALSQNGTYQIVAQELVEYKGHNYWLFDLYNFFDGKLLNVSSKYGYPIAVPYLLKETFKPTNKIPKKELRKLSLKLPEFYTSN